MARSHVSESQSKEGLLKVTGSHVCYESANISEMARDSDVILIGN